MPREGTVFISVRDDDKPLILDFSRKLETAGFKIVATSGTHKYLERKRHRPSTRVNKVLEGRPHIVDSMKNGGIQLVINTTDGAKSISDSRDIRRTALMGKILYYTTIPGATAAVAGIIAYRDGNLEVRPLQSLFRGVAWSDPRPTSSRGLNGCSAGRPRAGARCMGLHAGRRAMRSASGDRTGFVKIATTPMTAWQINREIVAYAGIAGRFVPRVLGRKPMSTTPILIIRGPEPRHLAAAHDSSGWSPRWSKPLPNARHADDTRTWRPADWPRGRLADGGRAAGRLPVARPGQRRTGSTALPTLIAAETSAKLAGRRPDPPRPPRRQPPRNRRGYQIHRLGRGLHARRRMSISASSSPASLLRADRCPRRYSPTGPDIAALTAGFFAARAGLPDIPLAPFVRRVQREQLEHRPALGDPCPRPASGRSLAGPDGRQVAMGKPGAPAHGLFRGEPMAAPPNSSC